MRQPDTDTYSNGNTYSYCDSYGDSYRYADGNLYADGNINTVSNGDAYCYRVAKGHADAKATSHAVPTINYSV